MLGHDDMARKNNKNEKCVQASTTSDLDSQCACCGKDQPEYALEDKQLCVDCYTAEISFWNKE
jgi:hypothetical protein